MKKQNQILFFVLGPQSQRQRHCAPDQGAVPETDRGDAEELPAPRDQQARHPRDQQARHPTNHQTRPLQN